MKFFTQFFRWILWFSLCYTNLKNWLITKVLIFSVIILKYIVSTMSPPIFEKFRWFFSILWKESWTYLYFSYFLKMGVSLKFSIWHSSLKCPITYIFHNVFIQSKQKHIEKSWFQKILIILKIDQGTSLKPILWIQKEKKYHIEKHHDTNNSL